MRRRRVTSGKDELTSHKGGVSGNRRDTRQESLCRVESSRRVEPHFVCGHGPTKNKTWIDYGDNCVTNMACSARRRTPRGLGAKLEVRPCPHTVEGRCGQDFERDVRRHALAG